MRLSTLSFILFANCTHVFAGELACHDALAREAARAEILEHGEADARRGPISGISALTRDEDEVGARLPSRAGPQDHVVSLGSGADVFRPLYVFPFAGHLHLVDIGSGWCEGITSIFAEIEQRLAHLGPDAEVREVRPGFERYRPRPDFTGRVMHEGREETVGPWRLVRGRWRFFEHPFVWRVTWQPRRGARRTLHVYLHVGDFSDEAFGRAVLRSTRGRLAGLFVSNIGLPDVTMRDEYLRALRPGGLFYAQVDNVNAAGESPGGEVTRDREALSETLALVWSKAPDRERMEAEPHFYFPTSCLFEKP